MIEREAIAIERRSWQFEISFLNSLNKFHKCEKEKKSRMGYSDKLSSFKSGFFELGIFCFSSALPCITGILKST